GLSDRSHLLSYSRSPIARPCSASRSLIVEARERRVLAGVVVRDTVLDAKHGGGEERAVLEDEPFGKHRTRVDLDLRHRIADWLGRQLQCLARVDASVIAFDLEVVRNERRSVEGDERVDQNGPRPADLSAQEELNDVPL